MSPHADMTLDDYRAQVKPAKRAKYRNTPTFVDGVRFDSAKEAKRWQELQWLQQVGQILDLERQPEFPLRVTAAATGKSTVIGIYRADFRYREQGVVVVEDVKSGPTKTQLYRLKKKHVECQYGIRIREI